MRRSLLFVLMLPLLVAPTLVAQDLTVPVKNGSVKFAVIGDTGTGRQAPACRRKAAYRDAREVPVRVRRSWLATTSTAANAAKDFDKKFAIPYKPLLDGGVKFYAALGNHDDPSSASTSRST